MILSSRIRVILFSAGGHGVQVDHDLRIGLPCSVQSFEKLQEVLPGPAGKVPGRLVHKEDVQVVGQCPGHGHPLVLAA